MSNAERDIIYWLTRIRDGLGVESENWNQVKLAWKRSLESDQDKTEQ